MILAAYIFFTILSTLWMTYFFRRRKVIDYEQFKLSSENQNKLYELMSGITDIKLNGYEDYKIEEWRTLQQRQYAMNQKSLRLGQVQNTGFTLIGQLRNILITCWIAASVVHGDLTLGMMMSISAIIGQVGGPLSQLIGFLQQFQDAKISLERSEEVHLCEDEDSVELLDVPTDTPRDIVVKDLSFSYTGSIGQPVLKHLNLTIPAGKMTAIVGESGSGKTTLMKLLLKFYQPTEGEILLGGQPLTCFSAKSMRRVTGIVMQDNFVFSDTIRRNIVLGEAMDEGRLAAAVSAACLEDYVKGASHRCRDQNWQRGNRRERRRAAAHDDRACGLQEPALSHAGRGHKFAGCRKRTENHGESAGGVCRPHAHRDSPPPLHGSSC